MKFKSRATGNYVEIDDSEVKTIRHMVMTGRFQVLSDAEQARDENGRFAATQTAGQEKGREADNAYTEFKSKNPMGGISRKKAGELAREAYHLWQDTGDQRFKDLHEHYDTLMMGK